MCLRRSASATEVCTVSLHDALPISSGHRVAASEGLGKVVERAVELAQRGVPAVGQSVGIELGLGSEMLSSGWIAVIQLTSEDRKSTRLNSSHLGISYAVFCLKKKTK